MLRVNKKVLYGFQGNASIFANINDDVRLVAYLSADALLPEALVNSDGGTSGGKRA